MKLDALKTQSRSLLIGTPFVLIFAFILVCTSELSFTWLALILAGLGFVTLTFLSRKPQDIYFTCYIATASIELTKGLIAEGGTYAPGLYLSLSDLFLLPLLISQVVSHLLERRSPVRRHPLLTAALLWLLWQWYCALTSMVSLGAVLSVVNQTKYFIAMWVVASYLRKPKHWRHLMQGAAIAIALHLIMSVIQVATGGAIQLQGIKASTQQTLSYAGAGLVGLFRPSGLLSHPNALADFLVLLLPMLAGFLLLGRRATGNAFVTMSWLLMAGLFMLILTLSRGGWMAFAVGMMCFIILGYRRNIVSALHIKRMVVGIVLGAMITLVAFPTVYLRLTESDNQSTHSRVLLAEQALLIVERNPIQGVGLGAYNYAAHRNMPESFSSIEPAFRDNLLKGLVHNKYLLVAAETGLVGLLLFLNVFRVAFLSLWRIRFDNDSPRQTLALGLLAGLAAGLSAFLLEPSESGVPIETTSIMLGACMALTRTRIPYATSQPKSISFEMRSISR